MLMHGDDKRFMAGEFQPAKAAKSENDGLGEVLG